MDRHFGLPLSRLRAFVALAFVAVLASACAGGASVVGTSTPEVDPRLGVAPSPRVTEAETDLPRGGGRRQVGRAYTIAGRTYQPRHQPNYDQTGIASWYGDAFHGRLTANGEVYDMTTLSAAHPTLPLPSYVRVTNLTNDRSVVVRVNDRGPFHGNRIIDLSRRAADILDLRHSGLGRVRVEYVGEAPLHGNDVAYLEGTARGVPGADNTILLAAATPPAPVSAPSAATAFNSGGPTPPAGIGTAIQAPPEPALVPATAPAIVPAAATGAPLDLTPPGVVRISSTATTGDLGGLFTAPGVRSFAPSQRIALSHDLALAAANGLVTGSIPEAPAASAFIVEAGVFGDAGNVAAATERLSAFGRVETLPLDGNPALTRVRVAVAGEAELATIRALGYRDAYRIR
ncbi:MAG: septal ring lytic transglycosylase RlpA family protein [Hyphomicrobiaceae bacterium]|nr:septal ring lytic transglycosylase RlpA family protein [Hyphomicrobiaceae bacterium]